jgi:hypothetical protein
MIIYDFSKSILFILIMILITDITLFYSRKTLKILFSKYHFFMITQKENQDLKDYFMIKYNELCIL